MVFICYQQDNAQNPSSWALTIRKKEFPDVQVGFRKDRNHKSNCQHPLDHRKSKELQKTSAALTALKPLYGSQIGKFLEMGIPDRLTCLLRNLYAGQETTVRTRHGTIDWFKIGKGVWQDCILSPCLFNLCAEYILQNAGLDESQPGIKIARRNTNNLRFSDDTTLVAEIKEELQSLLMRVQEERPLLWPQELHIGTKSPRQHHGFRLTFSSCPTRSTKRKWKSWLKTQHSKN